MYRTHYSHATAVANNAASAYQRDGKFKSHVLRMASCLFEELNAVLSGRNDITQADEAGKDARSDALTIVEDITVRCTIIGGKL